MGRATPDPYNQPLVAPADWWRDVPVNEILIVAGSDEVFVDDIAALAKKIEVRVE